MRCPEQDLIFSGKYLSMPLFACDKNFVEKVTPELNHRISLNFIFSVLLSVNIWWKLLSWWHYNHTFSRISEKSWLEKLDEIVQKIIFKICIINKDGSILVHIAQYTRFYSVFSQNSYNNPISKSIAWNCSKFYIHYIYFNR